MVRLVGIKFFNLLVDFNDFPTRDIFSSSKPTESIIVKNVSIVNPRPRKVGRYFVLERKIEKVSLENIFIEKNVDHFSDCSSRQRIRTSLETFSFSGLVKRTKC